MMPLRYGIEWGCGFPYTVLVSIYATDGTVAVSHGGVEVGQGINTKVGELTKTLMN
jgi:xanthine dehydrogenase/oxidase